MVMDVFSKPTDKLLIYNDRKRNAFLEITIEITRFIADS